MVTRKGRKITGGRYIASRKRKLCEKLGQQKKIKLDKEDKIKTKRVLGGNIKAFLLRAKFINIKGKDKKIKRAEIKNVLETPSNRFLARQNIITKGTIVQTDLGKVRVTNRPTQEGVMNGMLIE